MSGVIHISPKEKLKVSSAVFDLIFVAAREAIRKHCPSIEAALFEPADCNLFFADLSKLTIPERALVIQGFKEWKSTMIQNESNKIVHTKEGEWKVEQDLWEIGKEILDDLIARLEKSLH